MRRILYVDNIISMLPCGTRLINYLSFEGNNGENIFIQASPKQREALFCILSGLSKPCVGQVDLCGSNLYQQSEEKTAQIRCRTIGAVPAEIRFIPELSIAENILLPGIISGIDLFEARSRIKQYSAKYMPSIMLEQKATNLIPFAQALYAVIRASVNNPKLLLLNDFMGELCKKDQQKIWNAILEIRPKESLLIYMSSCSIDGNNAWTKKITL